MGQLPEASTRVVITGLGVVSALGRSVDQFWDGLTVAESASRRTNGACGPEESQEAAADRSSRIEDFGDLPKEKRKAIRKALKLMNRETRLGVAAGQQALSDSGILDVYEPDRIGVSFGADNVSIMPEDFEQGIRACSSQGQFHGERWGTDGINEVAPLWLLKCLPNMPACHLAIINDLRGPGNTITQRDVAASLAIAEAFRNIHFDDVDAVLVGATGTTLTAFNQMHAQLENEVVAQDGVCRPFDRNRTGPAPGEGAGALILEEMQSALRRGATIYGEVLGTASVSAVGRDHVSGCRTAMANAVRQTLQRSRLSADSIGHLHAHGLGTYESDLAEARAIHDVFSADHPPVVAAKSQFANASAGAGMMEMIASTLALREGHLFPVLNFNEVDPECGIRPVTDRHQPAGTSFLNLNMFGRGLASCVAIGAVSV